MSSRAAGTMPARETAATASPGGPSDGNVPITARSSRPASGSSFR